MATSRKVKFQPFFLILVIESGQLSEVGWLNLKGVGDLKGKVPRTLRGTEELHQPLYLCSSWQRAPWGEAVYTTQHLYPENIWFFVMISENL